MQKRRVGKAAEPTAEELEFIYARLGRLSDSEILEEMQDESFPLRSKGFIKRRRREFQAARKVLQALIQKEVDPVTAKRKEQHFEHLAGMVDLMISGPKRPNVVDLSRITDSPPDSYNLSGDYPYWDVRTKQGLTANALAERLEVNIDEVTSIDLAKRLEAEGLDNPDNADYADWEFNCLVSHLEAESPDLQSKGFDEFRDERPYEFLQILRLLAARRAFKGTCSVCQDW